MWLCLSEWARSQCSPIDGTVSDLCLNYSEHMHEYARGHKHRCKYINQAQSFQPSMKKSLVTPFWGGNASHHLSVQTTSISSFQFYHCIQFQIYQQIFTVPFTDFPLCSPSLPRFFWSFQLLCIEEQGVQIDDNYVCAAWKVPKRSLRSSKPTMKQNNIKQKRDKPST